MKNLQINKSTTCVRISVELHRKLRLQAAKRCLKMKELLEEYIAESLEREKE